MTDTIIGIVCKGHGDLMMIKQYSTGAKRHEPITDSLQFYSELFESQPNRLVLQKWTCVKILPV